MNLQNKKITVMGLGRFGGGVGVARWLSSQGALVTVTDTAPQADLTDSLAQLAGLPIHFHLGGHIQADFLPPACDLLVVNPAVDKPRNPFVQAALAAGVPLTTEINLFVERCPAGAIGITGSVGKSTTTMLAFLAVQAAVHAWPDQPAVHLGGNIGKSLLPDLPSMRRQDIILLELSSFMLEDTPAAHAGRGWSPHIAIVTNLFPNHLDRHNTLAELAAAKQNILRFQSPADIAILNQDDPHVRQWAHLSPGKTTFFSASAPAIDLLIPGHHNQSNAHAALAVVDSLHARFGHPPDRPAALAALASFPGLSHRLQLVHTATLPAPAGPRLIRFFNDSKATTPQSAITALAAFPPGSAIVIVGGYDKHSDMSDFIDVLAQRAAGVLGIGQTGPALIDALTSKPMPGAIHPPLYVHTLDRAVDQAWHWVAAHPSPSVILLSPACASWGQFQNYEQRGDEFSAAAKRLV